MGGQQIVSMRCDLHTIQDERQRIRQLIHDTLSQSLFSATTLSGLLVNRSNAMDDDTQALVRDLHRMLHDASNELHAIEASLAQDTGSDDDDRH